jgi:microcystin-dependent protein
MVRPPDPSRPGDAMMEAAVRELARERQGWLIRELALWLSGDPLMLDGVSNFGLSTVATAPLPASTGTSCIVALGDGARFPTAPFNAVVWPQGVRPSAANAEIVRVTAKATDQFTITRAQEGTSARSILVGDQIAAPITAKTLTDLQAAIDTIVTVPTGSIIQFGGAVAPTSFLLCDGTSYLRTTYQNLFNVIGVAYGSVDGTHFTVPDLRGRVALGLSTHGDCSPLGESDGYAVTQRSAWHGHNDSLTMPSHSHGGIPTSQDVMQGGGNPVLVPSSGGSTGSSGGQGINGTVGYLDATHPADTVPYQIVNHIIRI